MYRKNTNTWWSITGIVLVVGLIILVITLYNVTKNPFWLTLTFLAYLLRPTLASLGPGRKLFDERQLSINYQSSNIGFVAMLFVCIIFAIKLSIENNHDYGYFVAALAIGVTAKAIFDVILVRNFREIAPKVIIAVGLFIALFAAFNAGSSVRVILTVISGLAIAGLGFLSMKFPKSIAAIIIVVAIALVIFILMTEEGWERIILAALIGIPLIVAANELRKTNRKNDEIKSISAI